MTEKLLSREQIVSEAYANDVISGCAVYFLIKKKVIVYVGQSQSVLYRIRTHMAQGEKDFDSFSYINVPEKDVNDIEMQYIKEFNPVYNKAGLISVFNTRTNQSEIKIGWVTPKDAAEIIGVSRPSVYNYIKKWPEIRTRYVEGHKQIRIDDLMKMATPPQAQPTEAEAAQ